MSEMNISGIRGWECCHLLGTYSGVSGISIWAVGGQVHCIVAMPMLWPLNEPVSLPEGVHLVCHFTAGEFTQFAAAYIMTAP